MHVLSFESGPLWEMLQGYTNTLCIYIYTYLEMNKK